MICFSFVARCLAGWQHYTIPKWTLSDIECLSLRIWNRFGFRRTIQRYIMRA